MTKTQETASGIYKKLSDIQHDLKVGKEAWNDYSKYHYRNAETILTAVKPLLQKHELALNMSESVELIGDRYYVKSTVVLSDGMDFIEASAYAREAEVKKGMDDSQITGSATSYARKYALGGLFAIDDGNDADGQDNTAPKTPAKKPAQPKTPAPAKPEAVKVPYTLAQQKEISDLATKLGYDKFVIKGKLATIKTPKDAEEMINKLHVLVGMGIENDGKDEAN